MQRGSTRERLSLPSHISYDEKYYLFDDKKKDDPWASRKVCSPLEFSHYEWICLTVGTSYEHAPHLDQYNYGVSYPYGARIMCAYQDHIGFSKLFCYSSLLPASSLYTLNTRKGEIELVRRLCLTKKM